MVAATEGREREQGRREELGWIERLLSDISGGWGVVYGESRLGCGCGRVYMHTYADHDEQEERIIEGWGFIAPESFTP